MAKLTITRLSDSEEIMLRIDDGLQKSTIRLSPYDFAMALTGKAEVRCLVDPYPFRASLDDAAKWRTLVARLQSDELNQPAASVVEALRDTADVIDEACGPKMIGVVRVTGPTATRSLASWYPSIFRPLADLIAAAVSPEGR